MSSTTSSELARAPSKGVGPDYRDDKPKATVSTELDLKNVHILAQTPQLIALLTLVSNKAGILVDMAELTFI